MVARPRLTAAREGGERIGRMPDTRGHVTSDKPEPDSRDSRAARFERLALVSYEPLQRFVRRRIDAAHVDDVVADVLLVGWRRLDEIPPGAELPWCYGVARRCLANQRRSAARQVRLVDRLAAERGAAVAEPVEDEAVTAALALLRPEDRELLELWAWERLEAREIAAVLGVTPNAVSIRLHRAKQRLADALGERKAAPVAGHGLSKEEDR